MKRLPASLVRQVAQRHAEQPFAKEGTFEGVLFGIQWREDWELKSIEPHVAEVIKCGQFQSQPKKPSMAEERGYRIHERLERMLAQGKITTDDKKLPYPGKDMTQQFRIYMVEVDQQMALEHLDRLKENMLSKCEHTLPPISPGTGNGYMCGKCGKWIQIQYHD